MGRAFRRDPLGFMLGLRQPGDVVRFTAGFSRFALVRSPEIIHRVLVTDREHFGEGKWTERAHHYLRDCLITREGEAHAERRALLQPSFAPDRFAGLDSIVAACSQQSAERWREGQTLDVGREMCRITLTSSCRALFGVDVEPEAEQLVDALTTLRRAISRLPIPRPSLVAARRQLRRASTRLCRGSMVDQLRRAGLSDAAVEDEVTAMLFASFDTTSTALSWIWFALGRHPEVEEKLHAELLRVLGTRDAMLEDLPRLPYLKMVISEVLRLYPPVHFVDRRTLDDIDLGGTRLRAGEYILLSPLLTQRDPRFFDQPSKFWPERWQAGDPSPSRYAYFPFGDGPHFCIGRGLSLMVIGLTVAMLARRWRLTPAPTLPLEPSPNTAHLPMIAERRPWMP